MEINGILKEKFDTKQITEKFRKREFVLTTEANTPYPQHVLFVLTQDKCDLLNPIKEGTEIKINFNLQGREWNGVKGKQYFNTLDVWRITDENAEHEHYHSSSNNNPPF